MSPKRDHSFNPGTPKQTHPGILALIGLLAVVLQLAIAPNIAIVSAVPNIIMIVTIIVALNNPATRSTIYGFILGFCYDLFSQGPIGVMALLLTVMSFALSAFNKDAFQSNWIIELFAVVIALLLGELLHGIILVVIGYDSNILYSLVFRSLPSAIYEAIVAVVVLVIRNYLNNRKVNNKPGGLTSRKNKQGRKGTLVKGRSIQRKIRF
ncbi:MAG: rod shape-determining protein MreD [Coriobacteriia bacterium]|nr:rod shape-determining protein MreD [Coriobacteriia bacterium]